MQQDFPLAPYKICAIVDAFLNRRGGVGLLLQKRLLHLHPNFFFRAIALRTVDFVSVFSFGCSKSCSISHTLL